MYNLNQWRKLDGTKIMAALEDEVRNILVHEKKMGHKLKVCIGTDSQVRNATTEFATVIVFIRQGKGGFMLINNAVTRKKMSIKERMLTEVARSIGVAFSLSELFNAFNVDMELHADINTNPHFKSNEALNEAMGYIKGMGFVFRSKPEAFASSNCADKVIQ